MVDIEGIEKIRRTYRRKINQRVIVFVVFVGMIHLLLLNYGKDLNNGLIIGMILFLDLFLFVIGVTIIVKPIDKEFKKICKAEIIKQLLSEIFTNVKYDAEGLPEATLKQAYLFNNYTTYRSSDFLDASYQGKAFQSADMKLERIVSTGKATYTEIIFQGLFLIFDIERKINHCTQIYPKGKRGYVKSLFGKEKELNRVKFESEVFNQAFHVYCEDGSEAFYLLTPKIMEILLNLQTKLDFSCSFVDNKMYIAVESKYDLFEMSVFKPINEESCAQQVKSSKQIGEIITAINEIQWN